MLKLFTAITVALLLLGANTTNAQMGGSALQQPGGVAGPGSGTDNAIARWDGTGGSMLQDSLGVTIDDSHTLSIDTLNTPMVQTRHSETASSGSGIAIRRSRGTTLGGNTIVQDNDVLGNLNFMGADGTDFESGAIVRGEVDGTPSDGTDMPSALVFLTTPEASGTPSEAMRISSAGEVTKILQPCFLAFNSATDNNVTGAGTIATVDFDTEVYDQSNDFAADTFTAPVTGRYLLTAVVQLLGIPTGADLSLIQITTSNRTYRGSRFDLVADFPSVIGHTITVVADMDSGDTATVTVNVDGATDVVDIEGQTTDLVTSFSGCLIS